jgi:hypothetical protein
MSIKLWWNPIKTGLSRQRHRRTLATLWTTPEELVESKASMTSSNLRWRAWGPPHLVGHRGRCSHGHQHAFHPGREREEPVQRHAPSAYHRFTVPATWKPLNSQTLVPTRAVPLVTQAINSTGEETEQTAINSTGLLWLEENVIIWFVRALESLLFFFFKI